MDDWQDGWSSRALKPLGVLQTIPQASGIPSEAERRISGEVREAAAAVAFYVAPTPEEVLAHQALARALATFLVAIVQHCPVGSERSSAIARAREAKHWASAAIAMQRATLGRRDLGPAGSGE